MVKIFTYGRPPMAAYGPKIRETKGAWMGCVYFLLSPSFLLFCQYGGLDGGILYCAPQFFFRSMCTVPWHQGAGRTIRRPQHLPPKFFVRRYWWSGEPSSFHFENKRYVCPQVYISTKTQILKKNTFLHLLSFRHPWLFGGILSIYTITPQLYQPPPPGVPRGAFAK